MKVLPFTILVPDDRSVISEQVVLPYFYQYLHRHDEWQITWVEKGRGTVIAGTSMHTFQEGDVFMIGPNLPHLFKSNPEYFMGNDELSIKACSLYFNPKGLLAPLFQLPEVNRLYSFLNKRIHGFKIPKYSSKDIASRILEVHNSSGSAVIYNLLNLLESLQVLDDALEPLCNTVYSTKISENEGQRLSNIINFIMKNYNQQIALNDIANAACMTPQAFCRYFKQHTGQTFINYLNEVRIHDACKSLTAENSVDCISSVAYKAGFNSITNFNRVFKSIVGQSPRTYIESYKNISSVSKESVLP